MKNKARIKMDRRLESLQIHQWCLRQSMSLLCTTLAQSAAVRGNRLFDILKLWQRRRLDAAFPVFRGRGAWLSMYETPFPPGSIAILGDTGLSLGPLLKVMAGQTPESIKNELAALPRDGRKLAKAIELQIRQNWERYYPSHLAEMYTDLRRSAQDDGEKIDQQMRELPGLHFTMATYLPAYFLFQRTPHQLLVEARGGNDDAVEALVRIDSRFAASDEVDNWVHEDRTESPLKRKRCVALWVSEGLVGRFTRTGFMASLAGLISAMSRRVNLVITATGLIPRPLTSTAIREVFDAAVKDEKESSVKWYGRLSAALPVGSNLDREITRKRERWDQMFQMMHGQNLGEVVSGG
jgi:hypothetical protein